MPIYTNNTLYEKVSLLNESEFEAFVVQLSYQIFGPDTIYLDIKRKIKGSQIGVIPDGYMIDMTISNEPKLYVIENELVSHDPFKHIGIQMLKFVTSFEDERVKVRNILMSEISKSSENLKKLEDGCKGSDCRNIDNYLDKAVFSDFKGLVIIDEARPELYKVLEKINANISVLELKTYKSSQEELLFEFDTLYEEDEEVPVKTTSSGESGTTEARIRRRERRAECDTIIVPAKDETFQELFLGQNLWRAIRIGAAMKDRIKYLGTYRLAPISAVTHIAEIKEIKPYEDTGKYTVIFKNPGTEIEHKTLKDSSRSPQGPVYVKYSKLLESEFFDEAMEY
jgi:hypothetical protein